MCQGYIEYNREWDCRVPCDDSANEIHSDLELKSCARLKSVCPATGTRWTHACLIQQVGARPVNPGRSNPSGRTTLRITAVEYFGDCEIFYDLGFAFLTPRR